MSDVTAAPWLDRLKNRLPERLRTPEIKRFIKFGLVGGSGVVVNMGMLWLAMHRLLVTLPDHAVLHGLAYSPRVAWSGALAIAISILTNFLLNDAWTWGDRQKRGPLHFWWRLSKYTLVASVAGIVQWLALQGLAGLGMHVMLANFCGIIAGIGINFVANNWWTFRAGADDSPLPVPQAVEPEPETADSAI